MEVLIDNHLGFNMNTVKIKIHCPVCSGFKTEHEIDVNEYGYFVWPEHAYCPECFAVLTCVIDTKEN